MAYGSSSFGSSVYGGLHSAVITHTVTVTLDSRLFKTATDTFEISSILVKTQTKILTFDSVVHKTDLKTFITIDGIKLKSNTLSFIIDASIFSLKSTIYDLLTRIEALEGGIIVDDTKGNLYKTKDFVSW